MGHGVGYAYPHDAPDGLMAQQYLPDGATAETVYRPKLVGEESGRAAELDEIDRRMGKPVRKPL